MPVTPNYGCEAQFQDDVGGSGLSRLDASLAHAPYLFGTEPCIADFSVYASVWFLETLAPEPLSAFGNVQAWSARIRGWSPESPWSSG